jgi:hypothetical protein
MSLAMAVSYISIAAPYAALGALVLALIGVVYALFLGARLRRLALGRSGSLEETIGVLSREVRELKTFRGELEQYLKFAEARLRSGVSGVGIVRFNPFSGDGSGGNQSFAVALVDERGFGVVLSSLYARDRASVYAKSIESWASPHELSQEEKAAIEKAKGQIAARKK